VKTAALKFVLFFATALIFAGCAGHPPRRPSVVIGGGFNPAPNQVVTLTATVNNDKSGAGVTWTVVGAGTFTSTTTTLTYTAPATVPANPVVMVSATTIATPQSTETISFTIVGAAAVAVNITNPIATATAGSATNIVLNATVTNDVNAQGVSWQLVTAGTTTSCIPGCGSIVTSSMTSFTYLPPSTVPANPSTSLIATSIADPTKSDTDTFTIQAMAASNLMFLKGPYVFEASGFDASGNALTLAGTFTADGNGNIGPGEIDVNDNFTTANTTTVTGSYTLDGTLRGVITLTSALSAFSASPAFTFTIDSATNTGSIISVDTQEMAVSGLLAPQSGTVAATVPAGNFIFRGTSDGLTLTSDGVAVRSGMVGRFTAGAGGAISNGLIDSADIAQGNDSVDDTLTGTFSTTDPFGRGLISFNTGQSGPVAGGYAYYIVSANKIFLVETDNEAPGQFVAVARTQSLSLLTAGSVNGTGAFGLIGGDDGASTSNTQLASAAIGQLIITGGTAANVNCDVNDSGSISQCSTNGESPSPVPGVVAFDPTTGRGTITFASGFDDGFVDSLVFYLEGTGTGVMMDTTEAGPMIDSVPEALVGDLIPQTSLSDIEGQVQGLGLTGDFDSFAITGEFNVAGNGTITGLFDGSLPDNDPIFNSATGGNVGETDSTGRSPIMVTGDLFGGTLQPAAAFQVDPTQYFVIAEDSEFTSSLGIFTQQTLPAQAAARTANSAAKTSHVPIRRPVPAARQHKRLHAAKPRPMQPR
jgi:hypothetical protein